MNADNIKAEHLKNPIGLDIGLPEEVVTKLQYDIALETKYRDHELTGNWKDFRDLQDVLNIFCRETFFLQDQDALNILMEDHVRYLEPKWNFQHVYSLLEEMDSEEGKQIWQKVKCGEPGIIHYVSSIKPWNVEKCPMIEYYLIE